MSLSRTFEEKIFEKVIWDSPVYTNCIEWSSEIFLTDGMLALVMAKNVAIFIPSFQFMSFYTSKWIHLNLGKAPGSFNTQMVKSPKSLKNWVFKESLSEDTSSGLCFQNVKWSPPGLYTGASSFLTVLLSSGELLLLDPMTTKLCSYTLSMLPFCSIECNGLQMLLNLTDIINRKYSKYVNDYIYDEQIKVIAYEWCPLTFNSANNPFGILVISTTSNFIIVLIKNSLEQSQSQSVTISSTENNEYNSNSSTSTKSSQLEVIPLYESVTHGSSEAYNKIKFQIDIHNNNTNINIHTSNINFEFKLFLSNTIGIIKAMKLKFIIPINNYGDILYNNNELQVEVEFEELRSYIPFEYGIPIDLLTCDSSFIVATSGSRVKIIPTNLFESENNLNHYSNNNTNTDSHRNHGSGESMSTSMSMSMSSEVVSNENRNESTNMNVTVTECDINSPSDNSNTDTTATTSGNLSHDKYNERCTDRERDVGIDIIHGGGDGGCHKQPITSLSILHSSHNTTTYDDHSTGTGNTNTSTSASSLDILTSSYDCTSKHLKYTIPHISTTNPNPNIQLELEVDSKDTPILGHGVDPCGFIYADVSQIFGVHSNTRDEQSNSNLKYNHLILNIQTNPFIIQKDWLLNVQLAMRYYWKLCIELQYNTSLSGFIMNILYSIEKLPMDIFEDNVPNFNRLKAGHYRQIKKVDLDIQVDSLFEFVEDSLSKSKITSDSKVECEHELEVDEMDEDEDEVQDVNPSSKKKKSQRPEARRGGGASDIGAVLFSQRLPFLRARIQRVLEVALAAATELSIAIDPSAVSILEREIDNGGGSCSSSSIDKSVFLLTLPIGNCSSDGGGNDDGSSSSSIDTGILQYKLKLWSILHVVIQASFTTLGESPGQHWQALLTSLRRTILLANVAAEYFHSESVSRREKIPTATERNSLNLMSTLLQKEASTIQSNIPEADVSNASLIEITLTIANNLSTIAQIADLISKYGIVSDSELLLEEYCPVCNSAISFSNILESYLNNTISMNDNDNNNKSNIDGSNINEVNSIETVSCYECQTTSRRCSSTLLLLDITDNVLRCNLCGSIRMQSYSTCNVDKSIDDVNDRFRYPFKWIRGAEDSPLWLTDRRSGVAYISTWGSDFYLAEGVRFVAFLDDFCWVCGSGREGSASIP
eukprot:gene7203-14689_t